MTPADSRLLEYLAVLYDPRTVQRIWKELQEKLEQFTQVHPELREPGFARPLTQADNMLITYGDQVYEAGRPLLRSLAEFLEAQVGGWVTNLHILPFYPYSSDDGFSVIDYMRVDELLGNWEDVRRLSQSFGLMFDAVINHISTQSAWFKNYMQGVSPYTGYFIEVDPAQDLSQVFRPRTLSLLTAVKVGQETRHVWTTFSADQVDLNYANPDVLLEILDVLLFYLANQARFIRLDAIAFLWKEIGTRCLHLPQTHAVVKLIHAVCAVVAPGTKLITETNVPHQENISYFGNGKDEAHLVYNFALPPLVLHSFRVGDATQLSTWAAGLSLPSSQVTFFNFLASHDGIGVTPARGILSEAEIDGLVDQVRTHGGLVSSRNMPDGSQIPYELNISYFDALSDPQSDEPSEVQIDRFITSHAILLSLVGMPGIYFHSLFGSRSWKQGVAVTGHNRTINRQKLEREELENELSSPASLRAGVFHRMKTLLQVRGTHKAFSPCAAQSILDLSPAVFCVLRGDSGSSQVVCLHNVSGNPQAITLDLAGLGVWGASDLLSGQSLAGGKLSLELPPYGILWLGLIKEA
jgi:glucosylglycerate phosphorylase